MNPLSRWLELLRRWLRLGGRPEPSLPGKASSFHLFWRLDPALRNVVEVAATVEIVQAPVVEHLYFWALQATFLDGAGRSSGAAHLGLQWNRRYPNHGAANWGGYRTGGGVLEGTESALPSTPGDPNTRDYAWQPGRAYRLRITPTPDRPGWWRGSIEDDGRVVVVRDVHGGGRYLGTPVVWSEVFARCSDPAVTVRWSALEAVDETGVVHHPARLRINYQALDAGGCPNTDVELDGGSVLQRTATPRTVAQGAELPWTG